MMLTSSSFGSFRSEGCVAEEVLELTSEVAPGVDVACEYAIL